MQGSLLSIIHTCICINLCILYSCVCFKFKEKSVCILEIAHPILTITFLVKIFLVNRIPPPHLSPFIDYEEEGAYVPDYAKTIKQLQAAARKEVLPLPGVGKEDLEDPQNLLVEGIIDRAEANEAAQRKQKVCIF